MDVSGVRCYYYMSVEKKMVWSLVTTVGFRIIKEVGCYLSKAKGRGG